MEFKLRVSSRRNDIGTLPMTLLLKREVSSWIKTVSKKDNMNLTLTFGWLVFPKIQ